MGWSNWFGSTPNPPQEAKNNEHHELTTQDSYEESSQVSILTDDGKY